MKHEDLKSLIKVIIREAIEDDNKPVCGVCNGSGEGRYPGSKCPTCHGSGEEGYKKPLNKYTDPDFDWEREHEPDDEKHSGLQEAGAVQIDRLSPKEKKVMSAAFGKMGLDGNKRFESVSKGLLQVTNVLSAMGFNLDMVSGDILLGQKGQRNLPFRRSNDEGADPFSEKPEIKNSRIAFVWENLANPNEDPRYEILAYPS